MSLTNKFCKSIEISALTMAIISVVIFLLMSSGWKLHINLMYLWAILPYAVFFLISSIANSYKPSPSLPLASCITSILILCFTLVIYIDGMFIHTSSTSALLFLFVPFYLLLGGPFTFALILFGFRIFQRCTNSNIR